jgi:signal transduction histidine kinase
MNYELLTLSIIIVALTLVILAIYFNFRKVRRGQKITFRSISIQLLSATVWISIIANIFIPQQHIEGDPKIGALIFLTSLIVGVLLIRSIFREIEIERTVEFLIKKLQENNEDLKDLEEQKSEFVSVASHQLRSPLSSIVGYSEMMLEGDYGDIPDNLQEPIGRIFKSSNALGILINDFLNINKIEKGEMEYLLEDFNFIKEVSSVIDDFRHIATEKGLEFEAICENATEATVRADINKTKQIVSNIIDNSIKYTPKGTIRITCKHSPKYLVLCVSDTGIGIEKDLHQEIFNKFNRGDEAAKIDIMGTGLGLYIASTMIESMGGKIWAESAGKDKGSTFYIKLPLSKD